MLNITKVGRLHMGAYLCIASNGVPPSVSKRIMLVVHCEYYFFFTLKQISLFTVTLAVKASNFKIMEK